MKRVVAKGLGVVVSAGTVCALMANPAVATFPGDNGRILFQRFVGPADTPQIVTAKPSGEGVRRLTHFPAGAIEPDWSPDGEQIVFSRPSRHGSGAIYIMHRHGEQLKRLSTGCTGECLEDYEPAFSPDGKHIVFSRAFGPIVDDNATEIDLMIMRRDGSGIRTISRFRGLTDGGREMHSPQFSPDGERLTFMILDTASPEQASAIYTMRLGRDRMSRITPYRLNAGNPDWSPSGRRIVFNSSFEGQAAVNLYTVDPDGSHLRRLTNNGGRRFTFDPAWSPSGRQLTFVAATFHTAPHIAKMRPGGRVKHRVTSLSYPADHPDWGSSPVAAYTAGQ